MIASYFVDNLWCPCAQHFQVLSLVELQTLPEMCNAGKNCLTVKNTFSFCVFLILTLRICDLSHKRPRPTHYPQADVLSTGKFRLSVWVTWPERPKGAIDKVKMPEGPQG